MVTGTGVPTAPSDRRGTEALPLMSASDLVVHFKRPRFLPWQSPNIVHALDGVSLEVFKGETLGLVGETGCGKSTLARALLRLQDVDSGQIHFRNADITRAGGETLRALRKHIQPIFQDPYGSLNPRARVADIVGEPLRAHGASPSAAEARVAEALRLVGISSHLAKRYPHQLSGGQRQRVGVARAIALEPELIVADEPLSALDVSIQAQVLNLLLDLQRRLRLSYVFISHDLRVVRHISNRIAIMYLGQIVEEGPASEVCSRPAHPYTAVLLASVPTWMDRTIASSGIVEAKGEPPSPIRPPSGCRFHTRCPIARPDCSVRVPALRTIASGRRVSCHYPLEIDKL